MINLLKKYYELMSERRIIINFQYDRERIELCSYSSLADGNVDMIGIGKKGQITFDRNFEFMKLNEKVETMKKCKMIILKSKDVSVNILVKFLNRFSYDNNCFAPIVCTNEEVLYFPEIRYQDSYMLKSILDAKFQKQYLILFANKNHMMAIA